MQLTRSMAVLCFCFTAFAGALAQTSSTAPEERYRIGYQDTLDIQVFKHPELSKRVSVDPNGTISLFRLDSPILAVCKTEKELADDIAKAYEKDYLRNPEVSVAAVEQRSQAVSVIGAVEKPGNFYINRRIHLLELLAFAGGPKAGEVGTRIIVARVGSNSNCRQITGSTPDDDKVELLDFKLRDVQTGQVTLWMQPGDVVSVPEADVVYMYGNVNKQGAVKIKDTLTLTQSIALAEGLKGSTQKDNIRVLRQKPGTSDREEKVYDLSAIQRGLAVDPVLEPNDIVAISEDRTKSVLNNVVRSLGGGLPSVFYRIP